MKQRFLKRLNSVFRYLLMHLRIRKYRKRLLKLKKTRPDLFKPVDKMIERSHKKLWSVLYKNINPSFLRYYVNSSGEVDYRYVPQDLYIGIIERILNNPNTASLHMDKNYLNIFLPSEICPQVLLRKSRGNYMDGSMNCITQHKARETFYDLREDLIIKPALGKKYGRLVDKYFYVVKELTDRYGTPIEFDAMDKIYGDDYLLQAVVRQHPFTAQFNPSSLNSLRINTYRSVTTEQVHILRAGLKMGRSGEVVDNTVRGGVYVFVNEGGYLDDACVSQDREKFNAHPDSGVKFAGKQIPHFQALIKMAKFAASRLPDHRLLGLDVALDVNNQAIIIEVNIMGVSAHQAAGRPLFGPHLEEILEFCRNNRDKGDYQVIRT